MSSPIQFIDLQAQRAVIQNNVDAALKKVLEHGQFILGPEVVELEQALCSYTGAKHAISCASGTDALKLLLLAKDVKPKEVVFVPAFTFASTAEVVAEIGAIPYFVDVDADTFNICPQSLKHAIDECHAKGLTMKGVMPVDLFGLPADYPAIEKIAKQHNLWVVADAAQSFGGQINDTKVGKLTSMTATSFFPSKPLGGYGDGGCIFTEEDDVAAKVRSLRVHGAGSDRYDHIYVGINSRLDTFQAAILIEKLKIFDEELKARKQIAKAYAEGLQDLVALQQAAEGTQSGFGLYTIRLEEAQRDLLKQELAKAEIPCAIYYHKPLHQQKAYAHFPKVNQALTVTDTLAKEVVSLPMHPYLTIQQCDQIIQATRKILAG